jgi:hypothetical protein
MKKLYILSIMLLSIVSIFVELGVSNISKDYIRVVSRILTLTLSVGGLLIILNKKYEQEKK